MTPYELSLHIDAYSDRIKQEVELKHTMVWLGEYYHRIKRLPSLDDALGKKKEKKAMSSDEMLEMVKKLNKQFGGEVVNVNN